MGEVEETELPGVGRRFDYETALGTRMGVLSRRSGERDLLVYDPEDVERCILTIRLDPEDARTISDLLGAPRLVEHIQEATQPIAGLVIDWLTIGSESALAGKTLAEAAVHTRTGVSIVAILRGEQTLPAPTADDRLEAGDTVVAVGTTEGLRDFLALVREGPA